MTLLESIQSVKRNKEDRFFAGLMQYATNQTPEFDTSGDAPKYVGPDTAMPDKTALWNQYVQMKGGRLGTQDLALFEQYYQQVSKQRQNNKIAGLQDLSNRGYDSKDIHKLVKDTPDLYNSLLDMISTAESSQTPEGLQQGAALRAFMPPVKDSNLLSRASEFVSDNPIKTGLATYGALRGGEYLLSGKSGAIGKKMGLEDVSKKKTPKSKAKARVKNIRKLTPKVGTSLIASAVAPGIGEAVAGETGRQVGEYVGGGLMTAAGVRGLLGLTSKIPHPIAKGIGYGGLAAMGLYDLYNTATEE